MMRPDLMHTRAWGIPCLVHTHALAVWPVVRVRMCVCGASVLTGQGFWHGCLTPPSVRSHLLCAAACWMHKTAKQSKQHVDIAQWRPALLVACGGRAVHGSVIAQSPACRPQQALERAFWHWPVAAAPLSVDSHCVLSLDVWLATMVAG